ncbi:hypothetical protein ANO14919_024110 [Xylariales sp. No.14919]|nr:hypothetical protein ANO14919_024110 [Xylariales sp. No.14919]
MATYSPNIQANGTQDCPIADRGIPKTKLFQSNTWGDPDSSVVRMNTRPPSNSRVEAGYLPSLDWYKQDGTVTLENTSKLGHEAN